MNSKSWINYNNKKGCPWILSIGHGQELERDIVFLFISSGIYRFVQIYASLLRQMQLYISHPRPPLSITYWPVVIENYIVKDWENDQNRWKYHRTKDLISQPAKTPSSKISRIYSSVTNIRSSHVWNWCSNLNTVKAETRQLWATFKLQ
jgi:hypothetical protein